MGWDSSLCLDVTASFVMGNLEFYTVSTVRLGRIEGLICIFQEKLSHLFMMRFSGQRQCFTDPDGDT